MRHSWAPDAAAGALSCRRAALAPSADATLAATGPQAAQHEQGCACEEVTTLDGRGALDGPSAAAAALASTATAKSARNIAAAAAAATALGGRSVGCSGGRSGSGGVWRTLYPDGTSRSVRTVLDSIYVSRVAELLPAEVRRRMATFIREELVVRGGQPPPPPKAYLNDLTGKPVPTLEMVGRAQASEPLDDSSLAGGAWQWVRALSSAEDDVRLMTSRPTKASNAFLFSS